MNFNIGSFNSNKPGTYVIAEIGNNHNGSLDRAIDMIDLAHKNGADCVKFQMRNLEELYRKRSLQKEADDLGSEYIIDLLAKFELNIKQHRIIYDYCLHNKIDYLCTPWDKKSAKILNNFGVMGYKVASADLTNIPLISYLLEFNKPLILSTGMSTEKEIRFTADFLRKKAIPFAFLHCNSTYPAPLDDINLNWMKKLQKFTDCIGYSGHERGINISLGAVALGARIIERHFTLDRDMEGPDHAASLTPEDFRNMITGIREIERALGSSKLRRLSQGEMINRENLGKSLVASKSLKIGHIISESDIAIKSPGQGLSPQNKELLIGKRLKRNMNEEDFFFNSDLKSQVKNPGKYNFKRPWGIPIRYHDFNFFKSIILPDFWEFHLSYSDINLEPKKFISEIQSNEFIVHAPELFENSSLLDLASSNASYRKKSIVNMQKVIDLTVNLNKFFPKTKKPKIVTNIGGFSMDEPLTSEYIDLAYDLFFDSLSKLNLENTELLPQTMAPLPWHFGGQRYQNLFLKQDDIVNQCSKNNLKICLDISHSFLSCNYFEENFIDFIKKVLPYTAHIHLSDASGTNGEGLQIDEGQLDFKSIIKILNRFKNISFIPEIWQGHKNMGEGFWLALNKLNKKYNF